jgi:hypothetical protein
MPTAELIKSVLSPLAILFTNAGGRVIFANRNYLRLTKQPAARVVAGERLEALLPIESRSASTMMSAIDHTGFLGRLAISIRTTTGSLFPAALSGVAAHDENGEFIGVDFLLDEPIVATPNRLNIPTPKHTDVLGTYVKEVFTEASQLQTKTFMQAYVVAQVDILQVLLARMGGPEMRQALERILNTFALKDSIPAHMQDGYLGFTQKSMHFGIYHALLNAAVGYATSAVGRHIVKQEMRTVDRYVDPGLLELLTQMDLRTTFEDD